MCGHVCLLLFSYLQYEINFKDTFGDEPPPSSDEEDGPGDYDPLLDFSRDDDSLALQGGSMTTVSVKSSTDSARLRRGPSSSNRGMLDDVRDAQQALKQLQGISWTPLISRRQS